MNSKLLIVISSGDSEKVQAGLMFADNAGREGWMDDVRVVFFGPSERLLLEDENVRRAAREIARARKTQACRIFAELDDSITQLEGLGLEVVYVGEVISGLIKAGYVPMVF